MASFRIIGGKKLEGEVRAAGNKNSALKLMAASLLASKPSVLTNVPKIVDAGSMARIIRDLGGTVTNGNGYLKIDPRGLSSWELSKDLVSRLRASVVLAAPLLARFGRVLLPRPGGDSIGERLLDTHVAMLGAYGAKCKQVDSVYDIRISKLKPAKIFLEEASVTATEMALILASAVDGESVIEGAACEPHVVDLSEMLTKMGADIHGAGTNIVRIKGSKKLQGVSHRVRTDHVEVGTFAIAAAITGGDVRIKDVVEADLRMILAYLTKMGVRWGFEGESVLHILPSKLFARQEKFQTRPWPGFPTDLMSPFIVLATQTEGTVLCHDWMYEWRIFFVDHLISMGAKIFIADPHRVIVRGKSLLHGDTIPSADIRAGGALVLAALAAKGESVVEHAEMIDRGYEDFEGRLKSLGAGIKRVSTP